MDGLAQDNQELKYQRLLKLARAGRSVTEIAAEIGSSPSVVRTMASRLRRKGHNIPRFEGGRSGHKLKRAYIELPIEVWWALDAPAKKRRMSAKRLAELILSTVIRDGLVESVLDDGGDT